VAVIAWQAPYKGDVGSSKQLISEAASPRYAAVCAVATRAHAASAAAGASLSSSSSPLATTASLRSRMSDSSRAWRVGKCAYSVPIATPARRAISSSDASVPCSRNAASASASSRS
jgi:hypothetical protein